LPDFPATLRKGTPPCASGEACCLNDYWPSRSPSLALSVDECGDFLNGEGDAKGGQAEGGDGFEGA
jgi:hypothetical protein